VEHQLDENEANSEAGNSSRWLHAFGGECLWIINNFRRSARAKLFSCSPNRLKSCERGVHDSVGNRLGDSRFGGTKFGPPAFCGSTRDRLAGLLLASLFMFCSGLSFIVLSTIWMKPFTQDMAVLLIGAQVLKIAAFFQISDGAQTALAGALRGVGNTRSAFYANFVGHWVFGFPLGLVALL
jgi:hypothetical protein